MRHRLLSPLLLVLVLALVVIGVTVYVPAAWTPRPVANDALVRMPGTQPGQVNIEAPRRCMNCHADLPDPSVEPGFNWKGSMMAHAARDFLFYACMAVAGQDSVWAVGRPNAVDICERCHFPQGWLEGRSDPTNASAMTGSDFDGVHCDFCHRMFDPFFEDTYTGVREGNDWAGYWDEANADPTSPSAPAADATYDADTTQSLAIGMFNGNAFYGGDNRPFSFPVYNESGSGQYFMSGTTDKRASFADAAARHAMLYSRFHKSKHFCSTCHDVSNPALENLAHIALDPGDGTTVLPTEENPAYSYYHVERTTSEFMLSAYGQQGGAAGLGPYAPDVFTTSLVNNYIARCQDCHLPDGAGRACNKQGVPSRPYNPDDLPTSIEHPNSGVPVHDMTGGNAWVSYVLASAIAGSPNYDATNEALLTQGPAVLTLDLTQGEGIDPVALLAGVDRAKQNLQRAAAIQQLTYDAVSGALSFRVQNQTGHKLISGFPEGRRMFVNIKAYDANDSLLYEVNPYDDGAATLRGLPTSYSPNSPPLGANEFYVDELVYETHPSSALTGEDETFHFALATGRYKDNRIPPKGFDIATAPARLAEPVWEGASAPDYFTAAEYAGGYDEVSLGDYGVLLPGADHVEVSLYYQTTSREYVEFLRDEINGTGNVTLPVSAYIVQSDPFFAQLKAWGNTIWQLWTHNVNVPGAAPFLMASATAETDADITDVWWDQATTSVTLTFKSKSGVSYDVQSAEADEYSDGVAWGTLTTVVASGAATTVTDDVSSSPLTAAFRFYRIMRTDATRYSPQTAAVCELDLPVGFAVRRFFVSTPLEPDPDHAGVQDVLSAQLNYTNVKLDKLTADTGLYTRATYSPGGGWVNTFSIAAGEAYMLDVGDALPFPHTLRLTGYVPSEALTVSVTRASFAVTQRWMAYGMPRPTTLGALGLETAITPFWDSSNEVRLLPVGATAWSSYRWDGAKWYNMATPGVDAGATPIACGAGILFIHNGIPGSPDTLTWPTWYLHPPNVW
jgi:hypothetical protein